MWVYSLYNPYESDTVYSTNGRQLVSFAKEYARENPEREPCIVERVKIAKLPKRELIINLLNGVGFVEERVRVWPKED